MRKKAISTRALRIGPRGGPVEPAKKGKGQYFKQDVTHKGSILGGHSGKKKKKRGGQVVKADPRRVATASKRTIGVGSRLQS